MVTKTIPQLTALPGGTLLGTALLEISQTGSFKLQVTDLVGYAFANIPAFPVAPIGTTIDCQGTFGVVAVQSVNLVAGDSMTLDAANNFLLATDAGSIEIHSELGTQIHATAGDISIFTASGAVSIQSADGSDVTVDAQSGKVALLSTNSGNNSITVGQSGDVRITSDNNVSIACGDFLMNGETGKTVSIPVVGVGTLVFTNGVLTGFP